MSRVSSLQCGLSAFGSLSPARGPAGTQSMGGNATSQHPAAGPRGEPGNDLSRDCGVPGGGPAGIPTALTRPGGPRGPNA